MAGERIARELRLDLGLVEDRYRKDLGEILIRALTFSGGRILGAAGLLNVTGPTFRYWMQTTNLDPRGQPQKGKRTLTVGARA